MYRRLPLLPAVATDRRLVLDMFGRVLPSVLLEVLVLVDVFFSPSSFLLVETMIVVCTPFAGASCCIYALSDEREKDLWASSVALRRLAEANGDRSISTSLTRCRE
jgi:hypothetical protein